MLLGLCFSGLLSSVTGVYVITFYVYVFMCDNKDDDDDGWLTRFPVPLLGSTSTSVLGHFGPKDRSNWASSVFCSVTSVL